MDSLENKTTKGRQTQLLIMNVALDLFKKHGYDKISVDRIVKESKTSKGSFYQHFPSKSSIFMMRFMEMDKQYIHLYQRIEQTYERAIDRLEVFFTEVLRAIEDELGKDLMRVVYSAAVISNEHVFFTKEDRQLYIILRQIIKDGIEDKSIQPIGSPHEFFQSVVQCFMGAIYYWGLQLDSTRLEEVGGPLIMQLVSGMR